jgi:hypothetical protein
MRPTNADVYTLWGTDENHVYAGTERSNELLFFDGERWETIAIEGPQLAPIRSLWGTSTSNMFALTEDGTLTRFDGLDWTATERYFPVMRAIAGTREEVLAVGPMGIVKYHR